MIYELKWRPNVNVKKEENKARKRGKMELLHNGPEENSWGLGNSAAKLR